MLSSFVIAFLPRSKHLLISWLQSPSAVILEPKKIKSVTTSTFSPYICHEVMGSDAMMLVFCMLSFKPALLFHFPFSPLSRGSFLEIGVCLIYITSQENSFFFLFFLRPTNKFIITSFNFSLFGIFHSKVSALLILSFYLGFI